MFTYKSNSFPSISHFLSFAIAREEYFHFIDCVEKSPEGERERKRFLRVFGANEDEDETDEEAARQEDARPVSEDMLLEDYAMLKKERFDRSVGLKERLRITVKVRNELRKKARKD